MIQTSRDRHLIQELGSLGMLSTKQINELFFKEVNSATMLRRLRILEKERLIHRIGKLENNNECLWGVTSKGGEQSGFEFFKTHWSKSMLEHDHKLVSLRLKLESLGIINSWIPEHQIRSMIYSKYSLREAKNKLIPDGLIDVEIKNYPQSMAIELELNLKNKKRYQKMICSYLYKDGLHAVWYFVSTNSILNCLRDYWKKEQSYRQEVRPFFTLFSDLITNGENAKMIGLDSTYLIKNYFIKTAQENAQMVSTQYLLFKNSIMELTPQDHAPILNIQQT